MVYNFKWHSIHPKLVINFDQIGNHVLPSHGTTFDDHGATQLEVDIIAKDEKQVFIALVASTFNGDF